MRLPVEETAFALLVARLDRMEDKIDKLMAFRAYMAGIAGACGFVAAWFFRLIKGY